MPRSRLSNLNDFTSATIRLFMRDILNCYICEGDGACPNGCDEDAVIEAVDPLKDVDGFHSSNLGRLAGGVPRFISCTPYGILRLLQETDIRLEGADAVIVGRSRIVGRPMA